MRNFFFVFVRNPIMGVYFLTEILYCAPAVWQLLASGRATSGLGYLWSHLAAASQSYQDHSSTHLLRCCHHQDSSAPSSWIYPWLRGSLHRRLLCRCRCRCRLGLDCLVVVSPLSVWICPPVSAVHGGCRRRAPWLCTWTWSQESDLFSKDSRVATTQHSSTNSSQ